MAQERSVIKFIRPCLSIHEYKNTGDAANLLI